MKIRSRDALIRAGAPLEARDAEGWTPLHDAAFYGHASVVRLLMTARARIDRRDKAGLIPLELALRTGHSNSEVVALLRGDEEARPAWDPDDLRAGMDDDDGPARTPEPRQTASARRNRRCDVISEAAGEEASGGPPTAWM